MPGNPYALSPVESGPVDELLRTLDGLPALSVPHDYLLAERLFDEVETKRPYHCQGYFVLPYEGRFYAVLNEPEALLALQKSPDLPADLDSSRFVIGGQRFLEVRAEIARSRSHIAPQLVVSENEYNFVKYEERFLAVPQSFGVLDLRLHESRRLPGILFAPTLEQAREQVGARLRALAEPSRATPYCRYQLLSYEARFYAVPESPWPLDLTTHEARRTPGILIAASLEALRAEVDALRDHLAAPEAVSTPTHQVVRYENRLLPVPHGLEVDITTHSGRHAPGVRMASTPEGLVRELERAKAQQFLPTGAELLEEVKNPLLWK